MEDMVKYFLLVNDKVMAYSKGYEELLEKVADVYGDRLCIEYYGFMGRESILSMEYMDTHEGLTVFVTNTHLYNWDTKEETDIDICIMNINYLMEYIRDSCGLAVLEWLQFNKDKYRLDYFLSPYEKYCVY